MSAKKIIKISLGVLVFFTLPSLLFFGFVYFKYSEKRPENNPSQAADSLALNMLKALDYDAYKHTNYIEWTFKKRHHYQWNKAEQSCKVFWKNIQVNLNFKDLSNSTVLMNNKAVPQAHVQEYITTALDYFNTDSFWLIAPYTVLDKGVTRSLATVNNKSGLLVTYAPNEAYFWLLDKNYRPYTFNMWTPLFPIDGIEASWQDWTTTATGAQFPTFHNIFTFGFEITDLKTNF